ncbi:hypothetical protein EI555_017161, partial [Monodon monoceros]
ITNGGSDSKGEEFGNKITDLQRFQEVQNNQLIKIQSCSISVDFYNACVLLSSSVWKNLTTLSYPTEQLPHEDGQERGTGFSKANFGEDTYEKVLSQWSWHRNEKHFLSKSKIMTKCAKDSGN